MADAKALIASMQNDFEELKKEYNLFFGGVTLIEPIEMREDLLKKSKILRNMSTMKTEDQFQANGIISKIQSYVSLWDRQLRNMNAGRGVRRKAPKPVEPKREPGKVVGISDPDRQREAIVELYDEYARQNLARGSQDLISFGKFSNFIKTQTEKLRTKKQAKQVNYEVITQDGKVLIKSKSVK